MVRDLEAERVAKAQAAGIQKPGPENFDFDVETKTANFIAKKNEIARVDLSGTVADLDAELPYPAENNEEVGFFIEGLHATNNLVIKVKAGSSDTIQEPGAGAGTSITLDGSVQGSYIRLKYLEGVWRRLEKVNA